MQSIHAPRASARVYAVSLVAPLTIALTLIGSCSFNTTTSFCEAYGIRCRAGQVCATNQAICVDIGRCGDGVVNPGEVCDDSNLLDGDGCSANCMSNETCGNGHKDPGEDCDYRNPEDSDECGTNCKYLYCGDSIFSPTAGNEANDQFEQCDTGGESQSCDPDCTYVICGDKYTNTLAGEACDKGENASTCNGNDSPIAACQVPRCGDYYNNNQFSADGSGPEECDNGEEDSEHCNGNNNGIAGPGRCQLARCGDMYLNFESPTPGGKQEACDLGEASSECNGSNDMDLTHAGGYMPMLEATCQIPRCGDSYTNLLFRPVTDGPKEECDDGGDTARCNGNNDHHHDMDPLSPAMLKATCQFSECGDSYVNTKSTPSKTSSITEVCDDGKDTDNCNGNNDNVHERDPDSPDDPALPANIAFRIMQEHACQTPFCGDGYVNRKVIIGDKPEECDNGALNTNLPVQSKDKISTTCRQTCQKAGFGDDIIDDGEECGEPELGSCGQGYTCLKCHCEKSIP